MVGLILLAHGRLAEELLQTAAMIVGPVARARALALQPSDNPAEVQALLEQAIDVVDEDGDGVLILTDMFGGTPMNLAAPYLLPGRRELLTAMNLPMVLKFCSYRATLPLDELSERLLESARQAIVRVGPLVC